MHSYSSTAVLQESPTATLYRGVRAPDGRSVIIKALHPERLSRREVERLQHEYEVGQRLEGPYVMKPYALETFQGRPALVLEDFGGHPLTSLLGSPMETGRFLTLAVQLAVALASLHAQGIIHRDIKPDNLFVNLSTGQVKVSGFGLASPLPAWQQPLQPPALLEGTLAYMSPEQTGRMNRSVDQRSDLYSLGLTFYQMLAGAHPFQAGDPLEWVHCHLARTPQLLVERIPGLPPVLSRIVMRLLAKAAEDRYQIARGLRADLERCLEQWRTRGDIEPFALGAEDISDLLQIPPRLYGREAERVRLLAAFERVVARGRPVLALVHGPPGIGKTALVNELHRPLAGASERFLSGKFDQYKRDIPYSTLGQAFRALVLELLTGSEEQLAAWRERLRAALGLNGRLLVELIPQLRLIVGEQPPVPELPLMEAQNRFHLVFRQLLEVFTREEHPLVLFLDDLQWADAASLELLRHVLTHADTHSLFVIGAYRDTEVGPVHPLRQMAEAVGREGGEIVDMALGPLSLEHLGQLLSDTLRCPREEALPLARLIHERSAGNPFFATQLLTTLQREHLLEFDPRAARWKWDMERIRARSLADDVVDLLAEKLRRLPEATQEAVKLAACVGNSADVATLSVVSGRSEEEVHHSLWEAVREGVLLRQADRYQFLHDRVQQAAWSLIPGEERGRLHLRIGRLLLANTPQEALAEHLFDIVNHLNQGATHLEGPSERERLAELDLLAGRKAKAATAYAAAAGYLAVGLAQLPPGSWETHYELTRELYLERVQCEYMDSRFEEAEALLAPLLSHARGHVDKARILGEKLCLHELRGEYDRAVATARESLRLFGLELPPHPSWEQVLEEYQRVQEGLRGRRTDELLDLPPMSDPEARAIMSVLVALINPAMYTDWRLLCLILCHGVELSLRYGNADSSCMVYVFFGMVLCAHFGRYQEGYRFGQLGYELVETRGLVGLRARVLLGFGYCINPWTRPLVTSGELLQRAFVAAVETGDVTYASSFCNQKVSWRLAKGDPLDQVYRESERLLEYVRKTRYEISERVILAQQRLIRSLQGHTARFGSFEGDDFDEKEHEAYWHRSGALMGVCWHHIRRLQAHFMAGDWERALGAMQGARAHLEMLVADLETAEYYHYAALTLAACHESDGPAHREEHLSLLLDYEQRFREWARGCPENFLCRSALVSAEVARITGRTLEAEELYEQAIRAARESGFIHHEGLAYELASRFYRGRGLERFADTYLREARACYVRWGAEGKVRQLDALHPHPRPPQPFTPGATIAVQAEQLDVLSVVKASQGISEEMVLPRLQETLLKLVCEQAGAQKGCLLLTQDSGLCLHAQASTGVNGLQVHLFSPALPPSSTQLPVSLVHYVHRTRESLLLDDAASQDMFRGDEYLASHRPKSVLCMPILRQSRVVGLLYLENALATGAFTPDRLLVLGMLAAQAAISLENATLYSELQESQGRLQAVVDNTPNILFLKDTQGRYLLANPQYEKLLRVPRQQIIGREDGEFFPEEVAARLRGHDREVLEAGGALEREEELPQEDGPHTYLFTRFPLRDAAGTPYAVCGVFTDITERKQAERNERFLAEASRKLVTSLEYGDTLQAVAGVAVPELAEAGLLFVLAEEDRLLPAAVAVHSPEGKAKWRVTEQPSGLQVPRALYQVLRQGRPDFGPVDGLPLGALPPECAAMLEALSPRSALGVPLLARGHGLGVLVLLSARGPQGPRLLPLAEELGRRAALALDNARLYAQAQAAIHLRDDFLSVASHELRTPLTPLKLQLQLMEQALRKERPTAPLHRMVKVGMRQVERLEQLVSNLLDVSQMTAGRLKLHTEVVDLSEVVGDVAARFGSLLAHSGSRLELDIRRGVTGLWDRARLDQVVVNLLTNAIKFGQGNPIEVEVEADPRTARLRVRDHGIGIPPEHLSRIFGRFERAVTTRSYGGLGLGLYIASQIVDAHGGAIRVASEAGDGAAFTVELPRNLPEG